MKTSKKHLTMDSQSHLSVFKHEDAALGMFHLGFCKSFCSVREAMSLTVLNTDQTCIPFKHQWFGQVDRTSGWLQHRCKTDLLISGLVQSFRRSSRWLSKSTRLSYDLFSRRADVIFCASSQSSKQSLQFKESQTKHYFVKAFT